MSPYFIIDGLPRTGTTTIARIINEHPETSCVIEPYHPSRFGGTFCKMAKEARDIHITLALIRQRWGGLKHVWEPTTGWPFRQLGYLNENLVLAHDKVIFLRRRNYLKRYVSGIISAHIRYWIGSRNEFLARLEHAVLPELDPDLVYKEIMIEKKAMEKRAEMLTARSEPPFTIYYEEFYRPGKSIEDHRTSFNELFAFLGLSAVSPTSFASWGAVFLDPVQFRWSSRDVYLRLPKVLDLERELGSAELGHLFTDDMD